MSTYIEYGLNDESDKEATYEVDSILSKEPYYFNLKKLDQVLDSEDILPEETLLEETIGSKSILSFLLSYGLYHNSGLRRYCGAPSIKHSTRPMLELEKRRILVENDLKIKYFSIESNHPVYDLGILGTNGLLSHDVPEDFGKTLEGVLFYTSVINNIAQTNSISTLEQNVGMILDLTNLPGMIFKSKSKKFKSVLNNTHIGSLRDKLVFELRTDLSNLNFIYRDNNTISSLNSNETKNILEISKRLGFEKKYPKYVEDFVNIINVPSSSMNEILDFFNQYVTQVYNLMIETLEQIPSDISTKIKKIQEIAPKYNFSDYVSRKMYDIYLKNLKINTLKHPLDYYGALIKLDVDGPDNLKSIAIVNPTRISKLFVKSSSQYDCSKEIAQGLKNYMQTESFIPDFGQIADNYALDIIYNYFSRVFDSAYRDSSSVNDLLRAPANKMLLIGKQIIIPQFKELWGQIRDNIKSDNQNYQIIWNAISLYDKPKKIHLRSFIENFDPKYNLTKE